MAGGLASHLPDYNPPMQPDTPARRVRQSASPAPDTPSTVSDRLRDADQDGSGAAAAAEDASQRVAALEESLRQTEARLHRVLATTRAFVHDFDLATGAMGDDDRRQGAAQPPRSSATNALSWIGIVHPHDVARIRAELAAAVERGDVEFPIEYRIRGATGQFRVVRDHVRIERDDSGGFLRATGVAIDITGRERRDDRSSQLQALTAALSAALDPGGVGDVIIERAMPALGANAGNVFLLDASGSELRNLALHGYDSEIAAWSQRLPVDGETLVADVVRSGEPILIPTWKERLSRYPHHRTVHARGGDRAVAGLPLQVEGRIIGALSLAFPTDRQFDDDDRRFMATVADLCAQALERARLYDAVRQSEARFRQLADAMPQIAWAMSGDGATVEYLNDRWFAYTGQDPNLGASAPIFEPIHPDDLDWVTERWGEAQRSGTPFHGELRLRANDGQYRWFLSRTVPVRDESGSIVRWFGTSTDIDETKRIETQQRLLAELGQTLAMSLDPKELLNRVTRLLVPGLADYAFVDLALPDGQLERVAWAHADPREQRVFDQHLARFLPMWLHPDHPISRTLSSGESQFIPRVTEEWLTRVAFSPEHLEFMRARRLRSQITVPLRARDRTQGALTLCFTNASGRRYTEELLDLACDVADRVALAVDNARLYTATHEAEAKVRRLLEAGVMGVIVTDDERILEANDHFLDKVGYSRAELEQGRLRWTEMTPPEFAARDAQAISELESGGTATPYEKEYVRRDGSRLPILIGIAALQQSPPLYICFILDLTERKRAEDEWRAFVDATAHDLRNPLTAVVGQTQLLQRRLRRDGTVTFDEGMPRLAAIVSSAGRATRLIDDLMDTVRLRAGQPLEFQPDLIDLGSLVASCVQDAQRATASHAIRVEYDGAPLVVNADASRLERVIRNILDNAIKYSPDGVDVTVRLTAENEPAGRWAVLAIADRGIGIPAADLPFVFERFRRGFNVAGRIAGSGIGLTGAQQIVAQHGGDITAESVEGEGSTFTLRLPLTGDVH